MIGALAASVPALRRSGLVSLASSETQI